MQRKIAVVVSGFPRRSETFATNELLALAARGALVAIFATKAGDGSPAQPGTEGLMNLLRLLPSASAAEQARFVTDTLKNQNVSAVHGYFAHTPAEVAQRAAENLGVPFGFSVHARDARKITPDELRARANRAACVVACNTDVASTLGQTGARVNLIPHGVDLKRFRPAAPPDGEPFKILAVGRLVEKKGFHFLIAAVARLKFPFRLRIIGEGPERARLEMVIAAHRLADRVTLAGPKTHAELPEEFARAHVIAVPSIVDRTGDRDGLANVVLEAMACSRPVVASKVGAIGAGVRDGETGMLLPPGDIVAIASALTTLQQYPIQRAQLGRNARAHVEQHYEIKHCSQRFYQLLQDAYA